MPIRALRCRGTAVFAQCRPLYAATVGSTIDTRRLVHPPTETVTDVIGVSQSSGDKRSNRDPHLTRVIIFRVGVDTSASGATRRSSAV